MATFLSSRTLRLASTLLGCSLALGSIGLLKSIRVGAQTPANAEAAVISMTRGQGTFRANHRRFTASVATLKKAFGIPNVPGYNIAIRSTRRSAYHHYVPRDPKLTAFVGATFLESSPNNQTETVLIVCEANQPRAVRAAEPSYVRGIMKCAYNTTEKFKFTAEASP